MKINSVVCGVLLCGLQLSLSLSADPFPVMDIHGLAPDKKGKPLQYSHERFEAGSALPEHRPDKEEIRRGFHAAGFDLNWNFRKAFCLDGALKRNFSLFAARNDYRAAALAVFVTSPQKEITVRCSALTGPATINADQIRFLTIVPSGANPRFPHARMLLEPRMRNLKSGEQINMLMLVNVPQNTPPGLYRGTVSLSAESGSQTMPLVLRVMDFELPVYGNFGFYMHADFFKKGERSVQQNGYLPENLKRYFDFYKTRRLNSVTLYESRPDLQYVDGRVRGEFTSFSRVASAMKNSGLNGMLILDLRQISYWANAVAEQLAQPGANPNRLKMNMWKSGKTLYGKKAREIFAAAIRHLLAVAGQEQWPEFRLIAEEEIGNGYPEKIAGYESFMPIIMEICPDKAAVVDNSIGYGRKNAIDYGARDKVKFRQYNSWDEPGLAAARKDDAKILTFNYDPNRLSFGFLQQRLGAQGNHQWADLWDSWNFQWQYTRLSADGVVSSLEVEKIHEGCIDYAACKYLEELIAHARGEKRHEAAERGEAALLAVCEDLPILGEAARGYGKILTDEQLNARRWNIFLAIEELSGRPLAKKISSHQPVLHAKGSRLPIRRDEPVALSTFSSAKLNPDALRKESFWRNVNGPLRYLTDYEAQLRARSSSSDEFAKLNQPSHSVFWLAALPEGLAIYTEANHVMASGAFRYSQPDDSGDMWTDDCWELFFGVRSGKSFRLMFNAAGKKTFLNNGAVVPAGGIVSYVRSPINASGGTAVKLLVPWRYFDLKERPAAGSIWEFNAGREFHSYQVVLSWAPLAGGFHQREKWGKLIWGVAGTAQSKIAAAPLVMLDKPLNAMVIQGDSLYLTGECRSDAKTKIVGMLRHVSGMELKLPGVEVPSGGVRFSLDTGGMKPGRWTLILTPAGGKSADPVLFDVLPSPY